MVVEPLGAKDIMDGNDVSLSQYGFQETNGAILIERLKELFAELHNRWSSKIWEVKDGKLVACDRSRVSRRWKDIEELFGPLVRK